MCFLSSTTVGQGIPALCILHRKKGLGKAKRSAGENISFIQQISNEVLARAVTVFHSGNVGMQRQYDTASALTEPVSG